jgi:hypothetical protein
MERLFGDLRQREDSTGGSGGDLTFSVARAFLLRDA